MSPKGIVLATLAVGSVVSGAVDQYFYPGVPFPPSALAFAVFSAVLVFAWFRFDSDQIGYKRTPWINAGVIALGIVALPYYFFRSRGAKRGIVATAGVLLAYLVSGALSVTGSYATYYWQQS